jgi:alkylation response protein AidB-like acyl-CoA dehydrogenase
MTAGLLDTSYVLDRARELAPFVSERALDAEDGRTLPADVVARLGGLEAEPATIVRVVEEMSRADGSTGWSVLIGQSSGFLAWLDQGAAAEIVARTPLPLVAGSMTPAGAATPVPADAESPGGGWRLSGRWPFNSGCPHAEWLIGAFPDAPAGPGAPPTIRFAVFPSAAATIHENWRAMGLRGTGSHDVEVRDVLVSRRYTMAPFSEPARHDGPLYRLPFLSFLVVMMAGFPLGVGRRALDEFAALLRRKTKPGSDVPLADDPVMRSRLLRAETALRAARAHVYECVESVWSQTMTAGEPSPDARADLIAAVQHALRTAVDVVDTAFHAGGASALYRNAPLQRCWRDAHAARQHIVFGPDLERRLGGLLLGRPSPGMPI